MIQSEAEQGGLFLRKHKRMIRDSQIVATIASKLCLALKFLLETRLSPFVFLCVDDDDFCFICFLELRCVVSLPATVS